MLISSKVFLKTTNNTNPDIAIILGSGLTNFFDEKDILHSISYEKLPDFPQPTVQGHEGKLVLGDAVKLDFPDNFFDAVFSADFFEHISLEVKVKVISEVYRVLKPGGTFVIKTPNLSYLKIVIYLKRILSLIKLKSPFLYISHTKDNPDNEHHGLTTYSELERLLEDNFFHTPEITYVPLIRGKLPKFVTNCLYGKKIFTETIIITSRKAIFKSFWG